MRYLKMLGLAAVAAMALTAFLGAGSASATVLCKTAITTDCKGEWDWPVGTKIHAVNQGNTVLNGIWTDVICTKSTVQGKTTNTGDKTETVDGNIEVLTFEECKCAGASTHNAHVTVLEKGSLEIHHDEDGKNVGDGTLTAKGTTTTINCTPLGTQCRFGSDAGIDIGTVTPGETPIVHANATVLWTAGSGDEGSFICGSTAKWEATYHITEPTPLWVATS